MSIKERAIGLLERQITKTAWILAIRSWPGGTFYEVDIQVPELDLSVLKGVPHMKCRVAPLTFRDYTGSRWNTAEKTCTLFIDAGHEGAGSRWVKQLNKADALTYINIETHRYPLNDHNRLLFFGDQSTIGHFLALQQLAGAGKTITGALAIADKAHRDFLFERYPELPLKPLTDLNALTHWLDQHRPVAETLVCLAGNQQLVIGLRERLRAGGFPGKNIKVQAFW